VDCTARYWTALHCTVLTLQSLSTDALQVLVRLGEALLARNKYREALDVLQAALGKCTKPDDADFVRTRIGARLPWSS
jgi:hypothetical protein